MKVVIWEYSYFWSICLWDGESTYWTEEMKPSSGYRKMSWRVSKIGAKFTPIGEL